MHATLRCTSTTIGMLLRAGAAAGTGCRACARPAGVPRWCASFTVCLAPLPRTCRPQDVLETFRARDLVIERSTVQQAPINLEVRGLGLGPGLGLANRMAGVWRPVGAAWARAGAQTVASCCTIKRVEPASLRLSISPICLPTPGPSACCAQLLARLPVCPLLAGPQVWHRVHRPHVPLRARGGAGLGRTRRQAAGPAAAAPRRPGVALECWPAPVLNNEGAHAGCDLPMCGCCRTALPTADNTALPCCHPLLAPHRCCTTACAASRA